jgi:hypothetical protein
VEDLGGHAVTLALVEASTATAAHNARRILSAMLEEVERIVTLDRSRLGFPFTYQLSLVGAGSSLRIRVDHGDDAAHAEYRCDEGCVVLVESARRVLVLEARRR